MGYIKAAEILPTEVIKLIQKYVDGKNIYIPRKEDSREDWGTNTKTKKELYRRDKEIYLEYISGSKTLELASKYYLSEKSIQRIIRKMKSIDL